MEQTFIYQIYLHLLWTLFFTSIELLLKKLGVINCNLMYILHQLKQMQSKNSSSSLNLLRNSPCFPTTLIIFLIAPFKRFSYFWATDIPSFKRFTCFTSSFRFAFSSSYTSRIDSCNFFFDHFRRLLRFRFSHAPTQL